MTDKLQRFKPDTVLKNYWNSNEQFADLFNAVLFEGEQVIKPDELVDADTEESTVLEHKEYAQNIQASRDAIKIQKFCTGLGVQFVMYGLENQENIHYAMPMRVMGLDYAAYKKQYDCNAKKYQNSKGMDEDEYLSKMKRTDKFIPVVTVVVYYGEKPWDGAVSLHGMLDIPFEWREHVNDYRMNLVEARENSLIFHNSNNVDLFKMFAILLDRSRPHKETREKAIEYAKEHNVGKSVVMTVAGVANCKIDYNSFDEKGGGKMFTVFEEVAREGREEGEKVGEIRGMAKGIIVLGLEVGLSENDILAILQNKLDVSEDMAHEYFEMFSEQAV